MLAYIATYHTSCIHDIGSKVHLPKPDYFVMGILNRRVVRFIKCAVYESICEWRLPNSCKAEQCQLSVNQLRVLPGRHNRISPVRYGASKTLENKVDGRVCSQNHPINSDLATKSSRSPMNLCPTNYLPISFSMAFSRKTDSWLDKSRCDLWSSTHALLSQVVWHVFAIKFSSQK